MVTPLSEDTKAIIMLSVPLGGHMDVDPLSLNEYAALHRQVKAMHITWEGLHQQTLPALVP